MKNAAFPKTNRFFASLFSVTSLGTKFCLIFQLTLYKLVYFDMMQFMNKTIIW